MVVVDLPVRDEQDRSVLARQRLTSTDRVDDRQAGKGETYLACDLDRRAVGAAMLEPRRDRAQQDLGVGAQTGPTDACDPP